MNPVIPGDHPDCTLSKIGNHFYTAGSSFNPTPVIYHSTDLVHWEAIAQPVSAAWTGYGDTPAGGCWGGQVVYHGNKYWYFFSRNTNGSGMYFTTADDIKGPWSNPPTAMATPQSVSGLGYDNSIFIDDDGSWYVMVKNAREQNWIVQLGDNGQPQGAVYNLSWLNPSPSYPYSWAEGPVMWKYKGYYYYSFAHNVAGRQRVFRSPILTADQNSWVNITPDQPPENRDLFNLDDPSAPQALFQNPNHSSAVVMINDSTHWVVHPLWRNANNNEWYGQGRQGLLNQVQYDANVKPAADYPVNVPKVAPKMSSSGIPLMVPHSDFFSDTKMNPEWSFLGYTPGNSYSLSTRAGWLTLWPKSRTQANTIIKNDGEHDYSLMTRLDFSPQTAYDQAGIWIFNGLQTLFVKLCSSVDSSGDKIVVFSYKTTAYKVNSPTSVGDTTVWLKLVRANHVLTAFCSSNGYNWKQVGSGINVADMDGLQSNYNAWTGNRQGLFAQGQAADFDCYIYRDAYTPIQAGSPANQYGTVSSYDSAGALRLDGIQAGDWALYAGVEFGNAEYVKSPDSVQIYASCGTNGGSIEVWLDSLNTGTKIAECVVTNTGGTNIYATFSANVTTPVSGNHDVYLKFRGTGSEPLYMLQWLRFVDKNNPETSVWESRLEEVRESFELYQNYPNPFNPATNIDYTLSEKASITLKVYDLLGRAVATLVDDVQAAGRHSVSFDGNALPSSIYFYRLSAGNHVTTNKLVLLR